MSSSKSSRVMCSASRVHNNSLCYKNCRNSMSVLLCSVTINSISNSVTINSMRGEKMK